MTTREAIAPSQLETFLNTEAQRLPISIYLVRRLSPDSLSVMEFRSKTDIDIAEKMMRFPILGENVDKTWRLSLTAEFHMTSDSSLFKTTQAPQRLPLYEGKMIHQFTSSLAEPRYWLDEQEARQALLGRTIADDGRKLVYQGYRLGFRAIARNTDSRTLIVGPIPRNVFCGN